MRGYPDAFLGDDISIVIHAGFDPIRNVLPFFFLFKFDSDYDLG